MLKLAPHSTSTVEVMHCQEQHAWTRHTSMTPYYTDINNTDRRIDQVTQA